MQSLNEPWTSVNYFFIIDNNSQSEDPNFKKNENELLTVQI